MNFPKCVMALMSLIVFIFFPTIGQALDFPKRPIILVVPYLAGGTTDMSTRALAEAARNTLASQ